MLRKRDFILRGRRSEPRSRAVAAPAGTVRARRFRTAAGVLLAANMALLVAFQASRDGASYDST